jgi:hypothetical protein
MRKHWAAIVLFALWVSTDVIPLIKRTTPFTALSVCGAVFGVGLVVCEFGILVEEFKESAPLHVIWQPRVLPPPQQPYLCVHFESENNLPFEVRCTVVNDKNIALGSYRSEYQGVPAAGFRENRERWQVSRDPGHR